MQHHTIKSMRICNYDRIIYYHGYIMIYHNVLIPDYIEVQNALGRKNTYIAISFIDSDMRLRARSTSITRTRTCW